MLNNYFLKIIIAVQINKNTGTKIPASSPPTHHTIPNFSAKSGLEFSFTLYRKGQTINI